VRLALTADVHANIEALQATMKDIAAQSVDRIVCLGDIVGYNTDPAQCIALLRNANALCIAGNHDRAVIGKITTESFSRTAARAAAWTRARLTEDEIAFLAGLPLRANVEDKVLAVHGAFHPESGCEIVRLDNPQDILSSFAALISDPSGARIGAFGHTHDAAVYELRANNGGPKLRTEPEAVLRENAYYLINPGTVGAPRSTDRRAHYMILDLAGRTVTARAVDYDASAAFAKTRRAGLAPRLSFLPAPARRVLVAARALVQRAAQAHLI